MAAASSSSQPKKYDVFISFRGADVRNEFLSHLHKALIGEGLATFVDENLQRGGDISSSLLQTIEQSYLSLIIFTENYAFSPWCLDELIKICDCKKTMGQIVLPIFYQVDPTHVQQLTGSFGAPIDKHRKDFKHSSSKVDAWCHVLKQIAELSGLVSHNFKHDSNLIEEIAKHILEKLDTVYPLDSCNSEFVGIDKRVNRVESLLCLESVDLRIIGIWGMGGIGKTTIAKQVFDKVRDQFPTKCFVENVREKSENRATDVLQSEILCKLVGTEHSPNTDAPTLLSPLNRRRLARMKVLIVLDDVSDFEQVKLLIGKEVNYGPWSRIIMTSRDKQLLKNGGAVIYEVEGLYGGESLELFCLHAFKKRTPEKGYEELSIRAVKYAQGLPLALKVLGSNLYGKSIEEWEDELERLQNTSDDKIQKILRISYEGLCENDKELFLDIACFFKRRRRVVVERISGIGSKIGVSRLIDKSLISISTKEERLEMHDLIQQMGKDIICEEKLLGRRSRLWHHEDICHVLTNKKGTEAIKGISLDMSKLIKHVQLSPEAFEGIDNISFLKFHGGDGNFISNIVRLPEGLKFLSGMLRYLQWKAYPLKSLPLSFCAESLVQLHMVGSELKELWDGVQDLKNLKIIDLSYSWLVRIPDLSKAINLQVLKLRGCSSLVEIPSSMKYLSKLTEVDLYSCRSLGSLPCLHWEGLEILDLSECENIKELPKIPCYKRHERNATQQVTSSFHLSDLRLRGCLGLQSLPDSICNLKCLSYLDVSGLKNLHGLPNEFGNLESLVEFIANGSGLKELPVSIGDLKNIDGIEINECVNLQRLPDSFGNLASLRILHANRSGLKQLPESFCNLKHLMWLDIRECVNLVQLPENMRNLISLGILEASGTGINYLPQLPCLEAFDVRNCRALKSASPSFQLVKEQPKNRDFGFDNCFNLGEDEIITMIDHLLERPIHKEVDLNQDQLCVPGSEVPQKMKYKNKKPGGSLRITRLELELELEVFSGIKGFYFCVVLDPNLIPCHSASYEGFKGQIAFRCETSRKLVIKESQLYSLFADQKIERGIENPVPN